nr:hypothetical protein Iba_chr05cCG13600 [Ipomoea batatas]
MLSHGQRDGQRALEDIPNARQIFYSVRIGGAAEGRGGYVGWWREPFTGHSQLTMTQSD